VSAPGFFKKNLNFFKFKKKIKFFLISKNMSTCQVTIVPRVNASATCQFVVALFLFIQFSPNIRYFCSI